jgi:rod shape determining protein RodA
MKIYTKKYFGDSLIALILLILFSIGLIILYSATKDCCEKASNFFLKQSFGLISGIIIITIISRLPYRTIIIWGAIAHYIILILLILTLAKGSIAMGAKRWIDLGFIKFQPSELAKITLPLCIINYFLFYVINKTTLKDWLNLLFLVFITSILIIKQPDLGSGIIVGISAMALLYISGLPKKIIITLFIVFGFSAPIAWKFLHEYQKKRIIVFLGGGSAQKERYQLEQSKIAIGSGGIYGKGFLKGTQKNLQFLPENKTDFIFSVLSEEFGFLGVTFIILLYIILFFRFTKQCQKIDDFHAHLLCNGLFLPFMISIICNIGMVAGLFPTVGIPLPCMSYGITNLWSTCIMLGIINSVLSQKD